MVRIIRKKGITGYVDVSDLFSTGHTIHRWHTKVMHEVRDTARNEAPKRTGRMAASIYSSVPVKQRPTLTEGFVRVPTYYSQFVHGGTKGPIRSTSGKLLGPMDGAGTSYSNVGNVYKRRKPVKGARGAPDSNYGISRSAGTSQFPLYAKSVSGQAANPFLRRAMDQVGAAHRWRPGRTARTILNG